MKTRTTYRLLAAGFVAAGAFVAATPNALAVDWVIKSPGQHPSYAAELEPHLNFVLYRRGYYGNTRFRAGSPEIGGGFRASIELMDPGFVKKINDTIAITFGVDITNCHYCRSYRDDYLIYSPVALQWNFFLTRKWSVFGEVGGIVRSEGLFHYVNIDPAVWIGGRFHFNDNIALTLRAGYPYLGVGVSFFVGS